MLAELRGEIHLLVRVVDCRASIRVVLQPAIRVEIEFFGNGGGQYMLLRKLTFKTTGTAN